MVDAYFMLKKTEIDWAPKRARPAQGLQAGRPGPFLAPFGPIFRVLNLSLIPHLSPVVTMRQNISKNIQFPAKNATCSKIQDKIENGQVWVPSDGLVHELSQRNYQNLS